MRNPDSGFTVAIVGRPNVGKSTLFNRLAGKRLALVDDTPGVTRDWRAAPAHLPGLDFTIVDTAGLEDRADDSLEARMNRQSQQAVSRADVMLFVIDGRAGVTPLDRHFADMLRRSGLPVILVANKCEGSSSSSALLEAYELGLGEPVPISAEHGQGLSDLAEALYPFAPPVAQVEPDDAPPAMPTGDAASEDDGGVLQLAIIGRPNVGKSTLLNALVGEERVLTGPEAGMTRDAIAVEWQWGGRRIRLVDTAGMRRRARVENKVEKLAVADALRVIRLAQVVVLVLDGAAILDKQDLTIARMVADEGRALVIAVNKWDAVEDRQAALRQLSDRLETSLQQVKGLPTVTISARNGQKLDELMQAVLDIYRIWNRRVPTAELNRWLSHALEAHPPPLVEGKRVKIRYMTQVKSRPPTFALFTSQPTALPESYSRYLANGMREAFGLHGVPLRLTLRKGSKNPYVSEKS